MWKLILLFPIGIMVSFYYAWVGSYLWEWFVAPALGFPVLSALQLWGIAICLMVLRPRYVGENKFNTFEDSVVTVLSSLATPLFALALGYVVKWWVM